MPQEWVVLLVRVAELVAVRLVVVHEVEPARLCDKVGGLILKTLSVTVLCVLHVTFTLASYNIQLYSLYLVLYVCKTWLIEHVCMCQHHAEFQLSKCNDMQRVQDLRVFAYCPVCFCAGVKTHTRNLCKCRSSAPSIPILQANVAALRECDLEWSFFPVCMNSPVMSIYVDI